MKNVAFGAEFLESSAPAFAGAYTRYGWFWDKAEMRWIFVGI